MNKQEIKEVLENIKYKENFKIQVSHDVTHPDWQGEFPYVELLFSMRVKDVITSGLIIVESKMMVNPDIPEEHLVREIYHKFLDLERHEASEWFKYKGVAVFNEHNLEKYKGMARY